MATAAKKIVKKSVASTGTVSKKPAAAPAKAPVKTAAKKPAAAPAKAPAKAPVKSAAKPAAALAKKPVVRAASSAPAKTSGVIRVSAPLNKTALLAKLSEVSGVEPKTVKVVMIALSDIAKAALAKKGGAGEFTIPGLVKLTAIAVPAKPKRKGINPFTKEEQIFAAKPATVKVKGRVLKALKDAAL